MSDETSSSNDEEHDDEVVGDHDVDFVLRFSEEEDGDDDNVEIIDNSEDNALESSSSFLHSYLGEDMEELSGRQVHEDGQIVILPMFHQPGVVIVPGQVLPLNLFDPSEIQMMEKVIAADKTFGLMIHRSESQGSLHRGNIASVGVTCEIFSVRIFEDHLTNMCLKAEGRQRFKIISLKVHLDGVQMGKVRILPDGAISSQPVSSLVLSTACPANFIRSQVLSNRFACENLSCNSTVERYSIGFKPSTLATLRTSLSHLPDIAYKYYNQYYLMDCLMSEMRSWSERLNSTTWPISPVEFSYWMTGNLPLTKDMKIELLSINSTAVRLRRLLEIIKNYGSSLACSSCEVTTIITDKKEFFSLKERSPMAVYVNSVGYVHETVTFYKARNVTLMGRPTTEYSWFPGYAWTIASCKMCYRHIGWKFTATKKNMSPRKFWGLTRSALKPVFKHES